jgi:hypothetical protein
MRSKIAPRLSWIGNTDTGFGESYAPWVASWVCTLKLHSNEQFALKTQFIVSRIFFAYPYKIDHGLPPFFLCQVLGSSDHKTAWAILERPSPHFQKNRLAPE